MKTTRYLRIIAPPRYKYGAIPPHLSAQYQFYRDGYDDDGDDDDDICENERDKSVTLCSLNNNNGWKSCSF